MIVIRWIFGIISLLAIGGMSACFVLYIVQGEDAWMKHVRRFRHWAYLALLFWVNLEIWRRVALVIIHW